MKRVSISFVLITMIYSFISSQTIIPTGDVSGTYNQKSISIEIYNSFGEKTEAI